MHYAKKINSIHELPMLLISIPTHENFTFFTESEAALKYGDEKFQLNNNDDLFEFERDARAVMNTMKKRWTDGVVPYQLSGYSNVFKTETFLCLVQTAVVVVIMRLLSREFTT